MGYVLTVAALLGGVLLLLAPFVIWGVMSESKSKRELTAAAANLGLTYVGQDDRPEGQRTWHRPISVPAQYEGEEIELRHRVTGTYRARTVHAYPLHRYSLSGDNNPGTKSSWVVLDMPRSYPGWSVVPRDLARWRGWRLGRIPEELRLTLGDEEFDSEYLVAGPNAEFARAFLDPDIRRVILRGNKDKAPVDMMGAHLMSSSGGNLDAADLRQRLDLLCDILDRVPSHVASADWPD